ncbi:hypothetical protein GCM10007242_43750 [Pigmentiphaga litoralis]|nr:hypothetical protein GCM10007242_43750 [Pigmentiphaga litoralis]
MPMPPTPTPPPPTGFTLKAFGWLALIVLTVGIIAISIGIYADDPSNGYAYALNGATLPAAFVIYPTAWRVGASIAVVAGMITYLIMRRRIQRGEPFLSPRVQSAIMLIVATGTLYGLVSTMDFDKVEETAKPIVTSMAR